MSVIMLAWVTTETQFNAGKPEQVLIPHAACWSTRPRKDDLAKAQALANKEGYTVFTYESLRDRYIKAKNDIMAMQVIKERL